MNLATVIDLYTRMIVGWAMADHMRASLCVSALEMARDKGHVRANAIFNSGHGAQYTSRELGTWCTGNNVRQSMGLAGVCWDINAVAESAFSTIKIEFYHHYSFDTRQGQKGQKGHHALRRGLLQPVATTHPQQRPAASNRDGQLQHPQPATTRGCLARKTKTNVPHQQYTSVL